MQLPRCSRFALGVTLLSGVIVIWVVSAALISAVIYTEQDFQQPFFVTYVNTSLFSVYLCLFACAPSVSRKWHFRAKHREQWRQRMQTGFIVENDTWRRRLMWRFFGDKRQQQRLIATSTAAHDDGGPRAEGSVDDGHDIEWYEEEEDMEGDEDYFFIRVSASEDDEDEDVDEDSHALLHAPGMDDHDVSGRHRGARHGQRESEREEKDNVQYENVRDSGVDMDSVDGESAIDLEQQNEEHDSGMTLPSRGSQQVRQRRDDGTGTRGSSPLIGADDADASESKYKLLKLLSVKEVAFYALLFAPVWFFANVTYNWALSLTCVASSTILSSTSSIFTLLIGMAMKTTRFGLVRCVGIVLAFVGVVVVSLSDKEDVAMQQQGQQGLLLQYLTATGRGHEKMEESATTSVVVGDVLCLASAVGYGLYTNLLKRLLGDERRLSMAMFFGFVGAWNMLALWPAFFVLHWTGLEVFVWPSLAAAAFLLLNGLIGTVLSDWMWIQSVLLTTPLVATIGLSLTIPTAIVYDWLFQGRRFSGAYLGGSALVLSGFVVTTLAENAKGRKWGRKQWRRLQRVVTG